MNHKKLKELFEKYNDNIDGWLELGNDDMIDKCLNEIRATLNDKFAPCPSFKLCRNDRKNNKCFEGHPLQCFV